MRTHGYKVTLTSEKTGKVYEFESTRDASNWLGRTRSYITKATACGRPIKKAYTGERFIAEYPKRKAYKVNITGKREQLCCSCTKFCGGCSWSRNFTPVEGWDAVPTVIKQSRCPDVHSFSIVRCPEYEMG